MAHTVSSECVACGACVDTCPVGAITMEDKAVVDAAPCVDGGACEGVGPTGAIPAEYATLAHSARPLGNGGRAFCFENRKTPVCHCFVGSGQDPTLRCKGQTGVFYCSSAVGAGHARPGGVRRTGACGKAAGRTCPAPTEAHYRRITGALQGRGYQLCL